jgi:hypothetical protein
MWQVDKKKHSINSRVSEHKFQLDQTRSRIFLWDLWKFLNEKKESILKSELSISCSKKPILSSNVKTSSSKVKIQPC